MNRILVIKLGALGDFVQALGPMAAIRRHHRDARITLLTTSPYVQIAEASGYFDEVWMDTRSPLLHLGALLRLRRRLRDGRFDRVYDLQTSDRSGWYFRLLGPGRRPEWSGIAHGASHPHANPDRDRMHTLDRQRDQLAFAGIYDSLPPDLSWAMGAAADPIAVPRPYAVLVPGASPLRPEKRWPVFSFAALADWLEQHGIRPVVAGGGEERVLATTVLAGCSAGLDLAGRTDLLQLAQLGAGARYAIGNDTGPMHLFAALGIPCVVLFSSASDPALTAPRGSAVTILRRASLAELSVDEVAATLRID